MNENEFVSKVIADKKYMVEVFRHIPDEVVGAMGEKGQEQSEDAVDVGASMVEFLGPATDAMGLDFDKSALAAEVQRQIEGLSDFGKIGFVLRFTKAMKKAGKGGK